MNWTGTFYSCCRFTDTRLLFVITRLRVFCHASCCEAEPTTSFPKLRKDKFIYTNKQSHKNRSTRRRSSKENKHQLRKMTKKTVRRSGLHVCGRQLLQVQPALDMTQLLPAWSDAPERGETRRHRRRRLKHCANVIMIHLLRSDIWPHSVLRWCRNVSGGSTRGASFSSLTAAGRLLNKVESATQTEQHNTATSVYHLRQQNNSLFCNRTDPKSTQEPAVLTQSTLSVAGRFVTFSVSH